MQRLTKIALAFSLPFGATGCPDPGDNETNADETGAEESGVTNADTTVSTSNTTTASTTASTTDTETASTTVSTTDPDTTDTDPSDSGSTTEPPIVCASADDANAPKVMLDAAITEDTTLTCDTVWVLAEATYVTGATLSIEPGTSIIGQNGSALVIDTDAQLDAPGTADYPIIFTSAQPKGSRAPADWGGIVLLGLAEVNLPNGVGLAEGFADPPDYGGNDPAHNCGTLTYVRVEWAGFQLVTDNELNAITFYSCGTDTVVDHVQAHMGSDDGFEAFGGGFDLRYVVASGGADDCFDFDLGFEGSVQYAVCFQDPGQADANHGLEWSNGPMDFTATPLTSPSIANFTYVGQGAGGNAGKSIGFNFKQGTEANVYNSYFTNVTGPGATYQDQQTIDVAVAEGIVVEGTIWNDHAAFGHQGAGPYIWPDYPVDDPDAGWTDFLLNQDGNQDGVDLGIDVTWPTPNFKPNAMAAGAGVMPSGEFEATTYVGAVDPDAADDWTQATWINYAID
jgi:hypothetical protein